MADDQDQEQQELFKHALGDQPPKAPELDSQPESTSTDPAPEAPKEEPKAAEPPPPEATIPSWRLREEAEARRQAEDRARQLGERLQAIEAHLKQNQKSPDFFSDPNAATTEILTQQLAPFVQETRRQMIAMGKTVADAVHGPDTVSTAEQAFLQAMNEQSLDPVDYERVVQSPNRYDEVVKWHKRQTVLSSVGDDPNAWFEQQLEARMADPEFQSKLLEKVRSDAGKRPSKTELPPSLSRVTSARANRDEVGDMSNDSLFAFAARK